MESLLDFALEKRYKRVVKLGAKVAEFDTLIRQVPQEIMIHKKRSKKSN